MIPLNGHHEVLHFTPSYYQFLPLIITTFGVYLTAYILNISSG